MFADNIRLSGAADRPEEWNNIQMDLHKLEEQYQGNLMRFNKANCKMLQILKYSMAGDSLNYFIALTLIYNTNFKHF